MATTPRSSPLQGGDDMDRILKVLGEKTVHVSQLETENASLRAEIEALRSCAVEQERTSNSIRNNTPSGEHERLATKYENLSKLHRDLKEQHNKCASLIALEHKKYLEAKTICRQWKAYHDYKTLQRQTRAQQLAEAEQPGPITPRSLPSDPPDLPDDKHARISDLDDTPKALPGARQLSNEVHKPENSRQLHHLASEHPANEERTSSKTLRVSSSQSTDAGSDPMHGLSSPTGHREPSSDNEAVVIFTRPLKRKRSASALTMPPPVRIKQEENSPERPIEIKSEDFSSPVHNLRALVRTETSDLDAVAGPCVLTRKLRPGQRALSEEVDRRQRPEFPEGVSMLSDGDMLDTPNSTREHRRPGPAPAADDIDLPTANLHDQALRPLSVNVPENRRTLASEQPPPLVPRRSDKVAAAKAAFLSEDGDSQNVRTSGVRDNTTVPAKSPKTIKKRRLDSLLEAPTSDSRQRLVRSHSPESAVRVQRQGPLTPLSNVVPRRTFRDGLSSSTRLTPASEEAPKSLPSRRGDRHQGPPVREEGTVIKEERVQPVSAPKPQSKTVSPTKRERRPLKRPRGLEDTSPRLKPEDEPLRLRPLSALSLEDFKVNTKSTGAEHAFSETVRGRARRCLPGCTNPSCCGGVFLKAVQMGGYHGANDTNAEVLEKHFGENWAAIIAAYPPDKREKLLLEARASAFANQYGKHRQAFARRSTPPGFWRTDMPTTQQVEEDRAEAQAMVRQKVEERYREAMRDGGRWMFRDE